MIVNHISLSLSIYIYILYIYIFFFLICLFRSHTPGQQNSQIFHLYKLYTMSSFNPTSFSIEFFSKSSGVPSNMLVESRWTCSLPHQRPGVMFVKKIITTSTSLSLKTMNSKGAKRPNRPPPPGHRFFQEITIIDP